MRVVITAATTGEWMPTFLDVNELYTNQSKRLKLMFHQSGVGMLASAISIMKMIYEEKPDLIIQAGIAGTFDKKINLGKVFIVSDETLGDTGVEEENKWKDLFDLKLEKSSYHPFEKKKLPNQFLKEYNLLKLPEVASITVNQITTQEERMQQLIKKYNPVVESMEGASLHYVCREMNIPFIQIRSVSNYVGERDKANWKMKEAIQNLNQTLLLYIDKLYKMK
jgi:futalosine hydrolase